MTYIKGNPESAQRNREYQRRWLEKNREVQNERIRANAKQAKARAVEYVIEVKKQGCSKCPEKHSACLDFHHVDPSTKVYGISVLVNCNFGLETIKQEIEKCILLCANCHRKLHYEDACSVTVNTPDLYSG